MSCGEGEPTPTTPLTQPDQPRTLPCSATGSRVVWAVEGSNLRPTGYEPPALIFGHLGMAAKYELHLPVLKGPAQQQPVENGREGVTSEPKVALRRRQARPPTQICPVIGLPPTSTRGDAALDAAGGWAGWAVQKLRIGSLLQGVITEAHFAKNGCTRSEPCTSRASMWTLMAWQS